MEEFKVYKDTITASQSICDTKLELPVETEILIPDYLPQVFKIVKCFLIPVVLQKQVLTGRLTAEGYLRCVVYYQAEEDGTLCQTEQKIPFTKQVELPTGDFGEASAQVSGETEYVNCRALSGRRIDVRGAFELHVLVAAQTGSDVVTALAGDGVQQKTATLSGTKLVGGAEKLMTAQEAVTFTQQPAAVLSIQPCGSVEETKLLAGKAVLKGAIQADILCRAADGTLFHTMQDVPFNEILDVDGAEEGCGACAWADPTGCTIAQEEGENAAVNLSVTVLLSVRVWRETEYVTVADAFSTQDELELTQGVAVLEQTTLLTETVEAEASGQMPDQSAKLLDALATPLTLQLAEEDGNTVLRGRAVAHVLCGNAAGEIDCYDKACEYTVPGLYEGTPDNWIAQCTAQVAGVSARQTGNEISAGITLQVKGLLLRRAETPVLTGAVCTQPRVKEEDGVALRIYFAQAEEALFDIAKRYAVPPEAIAAANDLAGEALEEPRQLLIPQTV